MNVLLWTPSSRSPGDTLAGRKQQALLFHWGCAFCMLINVSVSPGQHAKTSALVECPSEVSRARSRGAVSLAYDDDIAVVLDEKTRH